MPHFRPNHNPTDTMDAKEALAALQSAQTERKEGMRDPVQVTLTNLATLNKIFKSLRAKDDNEPIRLELLKCGSMIDRASKFGTGIRVLDGVDTTLNDMMVHKASGVVITASISETRFSWWFLPAEVAGLGADEMCTVWIQPHDITRRLNAYTQVREGQFLFRVDAELKCSKFDLELDHRSTNSKLCSFTATEEPTNVRDYRQALAKKALPSVGLRMPGLDLSRKLAAMEPNSTDKDSESQISLHRYVKGPVAVRALVFSSWAKDKRWEVHDWLPVSGEGGASTNIDFRLGLEPKKKPKKAAAAAAGEEEDAGEDPDAVLAEAEAEAEAAAPAMPVTLREIRKLADTFRGKMEERELGIGDTMTSGAVKYTLEADYLFDSKTLRAMFKDMANELPYGVTLPMMTNGGLPALLMATPLTQDCLGVHVLTCRQSKKDS